MSADTAEQNAAERVRQLAAAIRPYHLKYDRDHDSRAVFAYVYYQITLDLADQIETLEPSFDDKEWVADLAIAFAKGYMNGMDSIDAWLASSDGPGVSSGRSIYDTVPRPWADVYLAISGEQSYVLEDLIFSMCAHITYDLPLALQTVDHSNGRLPDYHRMNEVLANKTDVIQSEVGDRYQNFLIWLDWATGSFDEFFSNYGIRVSRSLAWYNAMRLTVPSSKPATLGAIEHSTVKFIDYVRNPKEWWLRLGVRVTRTIIPRRRRWPDATPHAAERFG